jgi:hypothetical protein
LIGAENVSKDGPDDLEEYQVMAEKPFYAEY